MPSTAFLTTITTHRTTPRHVKSQFGISVLFFAVIIKYFPHCSGGCDLECGSFYAANLAQTLEIGALNETDLDIALTRVFLRMFELGMMDEGHIDSTRVQIVN